MKRGVNMIPRLSSSHTAAPAAGRARVAPLQPATSMLEGWMALQFFLERCTHSSTAGASVWL